MWRPSDTLANRFRLIRGELGISQAEMAARTGLPPSQIQSIEDGRHPRALDIKVKQIALALGVDRDWLMWGGDLVPDPEGPGGLLCAIRDLNPEPADWQSAQVGTLLDDLRYDLSLAA